jgi:two-component system, NtrC family, response regulator AtoC
MAQHSLPKHMNRQPLSEECTYNCALLAGVATTLLLTEAMQGRMDDTVPATVGSVSAEDDFFRTANSPAMQALADMVDKLADTKVAILIVGETGTRKHLLARHIHNHSPRSARPFRAVRAKELTPQSFPGGGKGEGSPGRLFDAGTLFIEEISALSPVSQAALYSWVTSATTSATTRIIGSSGGELEQEIRKGTSRHDLYYYFSEVCLRIPSLRHRKQDIPLLAKYFLKNYSKTLDRPKVQLSASTMSFLLRHDWPGNVRELEQAVRTIVAVGDERIARAALRSSWAKQPLLASSRTVSLKQVARAASRQAERELILQTLSRTRWNRKRAAEELRISYKALLYKLKEITAEDDLAEPEETTV